MCIALIFARDNDLLPRRIINKENVGLSQKEVRHFGDFSPPGAKHVENWPSRLAQPLPIVWLIVQTAERSHCRRRKQFCTLGRVVPRGRGAPGAHSVTSDRRSDSSLTTRLVFSHLARRKRREPHRSHRRRCRRGRGRRLHGHRFRRDTPPRVRVSGPPVSVHTVALGGQLRYGVRQMATCVSAGAE
jgi:hypothetical protein